jgi:flagellum-specific peptidoglycan hydrolase FlgJ
VGVPLGIIGAGVAAYGASGLLSHLFGGHKSSPKVSSTTAASSQLQAEAQNVIEVLMILRPWAQQFQQWFGQTNGSSPGASGTNAAGSTISKMALSNMQLYNQVAGQTSSGTGLSVSGPAVPSQQAYTGSSETQFVKTMKPYALQTAAKMGIPSQYRNNVAKFLLAEWADESAWGQSPAAKQNNNFAGIEPPGSGHYAGADHKYAGYSGLNDFANGDAYFLTHNSNYRNFVSAARKGASPTELANLLGSTPYATNPNYASAIKAFLPSTQSALQKITVKPKASSVQLRWPDGSKAGMLNLTMEATMNGQ